MVIKYIPAGMWLVLVLTSLFMISSDNARENVINVIDIHDVNNTRMGIYDQDCDDNNGHSHKKSLCIRNRPATEPVMPKVHNGKLSFDIWLVLYMYFILYS